MVPRLRTVFGVTIIVSLVSYVAYNIYLYIATYLELSETCEFLNKVYRGQECNDVLNLVNPKRAIFQELLRKWIDLAEKNNITYVLSSGSLLGQFRNQDIIPWDYDVDVLLKDSMFTTLQRVTTPRDFVEGEDELFHFVVQPEYAIKPSSKLKRWNCKGQVVKGQPDHCSFIGPIARLIKGYDFLDIFGLSIKDDWAYESYEKKYFRVFDLFPPVPCLFMDILTKCPYNSKRILGQFYRSIREPCRCFNGKWKVS